jgi:hypothetical protein
MSDPLDEYFNVPSVDVAEPLPDNPDAARAIETAAVSADVDLVRKTLRGTITKAAGKMSELIEVSMQMQDPDMIESATKMMTAISKLSVDLINIDLRVLQESKKVAATPSVEQKGDAKPVEAPPSTTAEIIKALKELKKAERAASTVVTPKEPRDANQA